MLIKILLLITHYIKHLLVLTNISSVGTLYFNNSNVTNMVLSTTGVGIGEINPNHKLEVVGSTKLRGTLEVTDSAVIKNLSGVGLNFDSSRFQELVADSGVITNLSGANLNYTSLNFNTLEADSGNFGTLSTDHFNADSGKLGVITSGTQVGTGPAVLIKTDTFQTKFHQAGGGQSFIEHAADAPGLIFKCTDPAAGNMHNSNIIWRNSVNGQKGFSWIQQ